MKAGLPANPRQMAHTMLDFPVPLAPIIIFRWGPGDTSQISYVLNYREVKLLRHKNIFFTKTFIPPYIFYRLPWIPLKPSWPYILMYLYTINKVERKKINRRNEKMIMHSWNKSISGKIRFHRPFSNISLLGEVWYHLSLFNS